jgi:predicted nucleic acid-binding protein
VRSSVVVDASAFVAVIFAEPESAGVERRLARKYYVAPAPLLFEVANVTLVKARRHPQRKVELFEAYENFARLDVEFADVDFVAVVSLAHRRNLSAYDSSYVWLALSRGLDLVSLDKRMIEDHEAERRAP